MSQTDPMIPSDYGEFLTSLKQRILSARITAVRAVNRELILLYWDIGRAIVEKQRTANWGDGVVEQIAADLLFQLTDQELSGQKSLFEETDVTPGLLQSYLFFAIELRLRGWCLNGRGNNRLTGGYVVRLHAPMR